MTQLRLIQTNVDNATFVHPIFGTKTEYSVGDLVLVFQGDDAVYEITKILTENREPLGPTDLVLGPDGLTVQVQSVTGPDRWHIGNPLYLQLRHYEGKDPR